MAERPPAATPTAAPTPRGPATPSTLAARPPPTLRRSASTRQTATRRPTRPTRLADQASLPRELEGGAASVAPPSPLTLGRKRARRAAVQDSGGCRHLSDARLIQCFDCVGRGDRKSVV